MHAGLCRGSMQNAGVVISFGHRGTVWAKSRINPWVRWLNGASTRHQCCNGSNNIIGSSFSKWVVKRHSSVISYRVPVPVDRGDERMAAWLCAPFLKTPRPCCGHDFEILPPVSLSDIEREHAHSVHGSTVLYRLSFHYQEQLWLMNISS